MQRGTVDGGAEQQRVQLQIVLDVGFLLALLDFVQRRLRDVDVAAFDQDGHLPIEEREQQRAYVRPVDVCVRVVDADAAHAGNEILIAFDRKVVDVAAARGHLFDCHDGKSHEIAVDHFEIAINRGSCRLQEFF